MDRKKVDMVELAAVVDRVGLDMVEPDKADKVGLLAEKECNWASQ